MTDYTDMVKPVIDKWNNKEIEAGYRAVYAELERDGWNVPPYHHFRSMMLEAGKGLFQPLRPTHLSVDRKDVQLARLIDVLHKHGYSKDGVKHDAADKETKRSQKYSDGSEKSLEDIFGKYNKELSTNDFSVHTKEGKVHIAFRGSRTKLDDVNTLRDWSTNIGGHLGGASATKMLPQNRQIESDLAEVEKKLGKFNDTDYHFTGYSKGGGTLAGALYYGDKYGVSTTTFNPHISDDFDFNRNPKVKHLIHRTTEDPATLGLAKKDLPKNVELKSYPSLNKFNNALGSHSSENFTEDRMPRQNLGSPTSTDPYARSVIPKIVTRFQAHGALQKLHSQLSEIDRAIALKHLPMGKYLDAVKSGTRQVLDTMDEGQELEGGRVFRQRLQPVEEGQEFPISRRMTSTREPIEMSGGVRNYLSRGMPSSSTDPIKLPPSMQTPKKISTTRDSSALTDAKIQQDNANFARLKALQEHVNTPLGSDALEIERKNMREKYRLPKADVSKIGKMKADAPEAVEFTHSRKVLADMKAMEEQFKEEYGPAKAKLLIKEIVDHDIKLGQRQFMTPDEMKSFVADKINELERFSNREMLTTSTRPGKSSLVQAKMAATDPTPPDVVGMGDAPSSMDKAAIRTGELDVGKQTGLLPADKMKAYAQSTDDDRFAIREHLANKIRISADQLNTDYIQPYSKATAGAMMKSDTLRSRVSAGAGRLLNVRGMAAGAAGLGIGAAIGLAENYIPGFDSMNQYEASAITGAVTGAATEMAVNRLTGIATASLRGLSNIGSSVLSGGVGLVVGDLATNAILGAFGANANPYEKNMIADIAGGEIGLMAGLGIAGGVSVAAGILGVAGAEGAVAATNFWNPIGWGAAIGAGLTAVGGAIAGWFTGNAEAKAAAKRAKEKVEIGYAANADTLKSQYDYIRTYATQLGMNPDEIQVLLQPSLEFKLRDSKVKPMTKPQMTFLLNNVIQHFTLGDGTYEHGTQTSSQELTEVLRQKSIQNQSMLNELVTKIKNKGGTATMPVVGGLFNNNTFWTEWNKLIDANPSIAQKLGFSKFNIPGPESVKSAAAVALSHITPASFSDASGQIEAWEQQIVTEGQMERANSAADILVWKSLATQSPNLAPVYNKIITSLGGNPVPLSATAKADESSGVLGAGSTGAQYKIQQADITKWKALAKSHPSMAPALNGLVDAASMGGNTIDAQTSQIIANGAKKAYSGTTKSVTAQSNQIGEDIQNQSVFDAVYNNMVKKGQVYTGNRPIPAGAVLTAANKKFGLTLQQQVNANYAKSRDQMIPAAAKIIAGLTANPPGGQGTGVNPVVKSDGKTLSGIKHFYQKPVPSSANAVKTTPVVPQITQSGPPKIQKASGTLAAARARLAAKRSSPTSITAPAPTFVAKPVIKVQPMNSGFGRMSIAQLNKIAGASTPLNPGNIPGM